MLALVLKALQDYGTGESGSCLLIISALTTYSLDTLPDLKSLQSTLPTPSFHSSPRAASNSSCVRPGANRRITTFNLGTEVLPCTALVGRVIGAPFCVAAAGIERMPPEKAIFEILALVT